MPNRRTLKHAPTFRRFSAMPKGPEWLHLRRDPAEVGGPGAPPPGFVVGQTSADEWIFYWAMAKVTGTPKDPRMPPFFGGDDWIYQKAVDGGRKKGGAVLDFYYTGSTPPIGIRIQTERYHIFTTGRKQAYDALQKQEVSQNYVVVDVFSQDYLADPSGNTACKIAAQAIKGEGRVDVLGTGRGMRVRP